VKTGYGYSPFGTTYKSNTNSNNNLLFTGRELDLGGTVYYFRGRYYNTGFQRFLSEDPIGFAGGDTNLYRYVGNTPLVGSDPTGLADTILVGGITASQGGSGNNGGFSLFDFFGSLLSNFFGGPQIPTVNPSMGSMSTGGQSTHGVRIDGNSEYFCGKYRIGCDAVDGNQNVYKSEFKEVTQPAGSIRNVNPKPGLGRTDNCANCAVATDATLAGRPASALPGVRTPIQVLEGLFGGVFRNASIGSIKYGLRSAGNGARGIVYGYRSDGTAHVFNAVNQRGIIRFLDGQTGGAASLNGYAGFGFLRTN
jgi:RHS repeat-associated protein